MSELNLQDNGSKTFFDGNETEQQSLRKDHNQQQEEQEQSNKAHQQNLAEKDSNGGSLNEIAHTQAKATFDSYDYESIKAHILVAVKPAIMQRTIIHQEQVIHNNESQHQTVQDKTQDFSRRTFQEEQSNSFSGKAFQEEQSNSFSGRAFQEEHSDTFSSNATTHRREENGETLTDWARRMLSENAEQYTHLEELLAENTEKIIKLQGKLPRVTYRRLRPRFLWDENGNARLRIDRVKETHILTQKEYHKKHKKELKRERKQRIRNDRLRRFGRLMFSDENIQEDEDMATVKMLGRRAGSMAEKKLRNSIHTLTDKQPYYRRLQFDNRYERTLHRGEERLRKDVGRIRATNRKIVEQAGSTEKRNAESIKKARMEENRRIQQRNRQRRKWKAKTEKQIAQGQRRTQHSLKKITRKEQKLIRKRSMKMISSVASIVGTLVMSMFMLVMFIMTFLSLFANIFTTSVTQNDYTVITSATEYLKKLETDTEEMIVTKRDEIEKEIDNQYYAASGVHIDEFNYSLPDFGFDANTLIAYLSAKYGTFTLEGVKAELDEIHAIMYQLSSSIKTEERTAYDAQNNPYLIYVTVCYIKLEKTSLESIVEARLSGETLQQYKNYKLTVGGQQIYGPVLDRIDWSNKITSDFGERIHPVSGERKFHDGVDIAIPTGTKLFAVVDGTITVAKYSDSAGNMITIKSESGWEVTYMHMDSISVAKGQLVERGELVGYSGNTGISTGPHLHLQVHDSAGNKINPIFIVPQNGRILSEEE